MEDTSLKHALRARFRAQRRSLGDVLRKRLDRCINEGILELVTLERAHSHPASPAVSPGFTVSAYLAFDGEPDVRPALQSLSRQGVRIVVPAIVTSSGKRLLEFREWAPDGPLAQSALGIDQPAQGAGVPAQDLHIMLMPLVAWDERGHRLGMGAGYYDRSLAALACSGRPLRVGVAYAAQKYPELPSDPWDVRLHEVITEEGRFTCAS